jgi:hypothetical protein
MTFRRSVARAMARLIEVDSCWYAAPYDAMYRTCDNA